MAANLSAKGKEPQIVIIGETHPINMLGDILNLVNSLVMLREKGITNEELKPLLNLSKERLDLMQKICGFELRYIKEYDVHKIIIERPVDLEKTLFGKAGYAAIMVTIRTLEVKFLPKIKKEFGNELCMKFETIFLILSSYLNKCSKAESLEFRLIAKAGSFMENKRLGAPLREIFASLKLAIVKKQTGQNMLLICGADHVPAYDRFLQALGYRTKIIILPEVEKNNNIKKEIWKETNRLLTRLIERGLRAGKITGNKFKLKDIL